MAYIQKPRNNAPQTKSLTISDFSGGLNNKSQDIALNEASELLNMRFTDGTLLEKRWGSKVHKDGSEWVTPGFISERNTPIQHIDKYRSYTGEHDSLVIISQNIVFMKYAKNDESSIFKFQHAVANLYDVINISGKNFMGKYFIAGDNLSFIGKVPLKSTTYEKVVGDDVTGEFTHDGKGYSKYPLWFEIVSTPVKGGANYEDYLAPYLTPLGTTHTRGHTVYSPNDGICFYVPCENELKDPYLGKSVVPEYANLIEAHGGRLYVAGMKKENDSIYLSQVNSPLYFPAGLGLQLTANSDQITGLKSFDGGMVVTRNEDIHVIKGVTNNPTYELELFSIKRLNTHTGCPSGRTLTPVYEYLFYLGTDGQVYVLSAIDTDDKTLASTLVSHKLDFTKSPFNLKSTDFKESFAIFHNDEFYLGIKNKYVFVYNYTNKSFTVYEGLNATCFGMVDGEMMWGTLPDANGKHALMKWDKAAYTDRGVPYKSHWKSGLLNLGDPIAYKLFREYFVTKETSANQNDLLITFEIDGNVTSAYDTNHAIAKWGASQWGDRHVNEGIIASDPMLIGERGRTVRIKLSSGDIKEADIKTVQTEADLIDVTPKVPNMLVKVTDTGYYYSYKVFGWKKEFRELHFNQPIKIHQINLIYETKGRR